jgi:hypothetical protein
MIVLWWKLVKRLSAVTAMQQSDNARSQALCFEQREARIGITIDNVGWACESQNLVVGG